MPELTESEKRYIAAEEVAVTLSDSLRCEVTPMMGPSGLWVHRIRIGYREARVYRADDGKWAVIAEGRPDARFDTLVGVVEFLEELRD